MHPYLHDPARASAFADLVACPNGTQRVWAARWGWSVPRVQRFLAALVRYQLADLRVTRFGTEVRARLAPDAEPMQSRCAADAPSHEDGVLGADAQPMQTRCTADAEPMRLGTGKLDKQPRILDAGRDYTQQLLEVMNGLLADRFGPEYRAIREDNRSSLRAGAQLEAAGIPLDFAVAELRRGCVLFNPSKHGGGSAPRSLAYFVRGILQGWAARAQQELRLLTLEPSAAARGEPRVRAAAPSPHRAAAPTPLADTITDWRASYLAVGGAPPVLRERRA